MVEDVTFVNIHQCFTLIFQPFHAQEYSKFGIAGLGLEGFNNLRLLLDHVMLRRTKLKEQTIWVYHQELLK